MDTAAVVAFAAIGIMFIGILGVFHNRSKRERGIGGRAIQAITVILTVPTILALAALEILRSDTVAALLGALIGYTLSGLSDFETEKTRRKKLEKDKEQHSR
ncbi:MAG: hypothetical protein ACE5G1_16390 [bacterium]